MKTPNAAVIIRIRAVGQRASVSVKGMSDSAQPVDTIVAEINSCRTEQKLRKFFRNIKLLWPRKSIRISSTNMAASLFFGHCKPEIERIYGHMRGSLGTLVMISPVHEETRGLITSSSEDFLFMVRILVE